MELKVCRTRSIVWLAAAVAAIGGCSSKPAQVPVFSVRGKLLINGQPAAKATIYFHPRQVIVGGNPLPFGVVDSSGNYQPSTYAGQDGLPLGDYAVTVVWPRYVTFDEQEIASDDRCQGKFSDPHRPVLTITMTPQTQELPLLDLKL